MAKFPAAEKRLFSNVWICMRCNAKNRASPGKQPAKCRKCQSKRFRLKNKAKKAAGTKA
ncbi:MAG: 50S ribosomal protein L40e [archaeon]|nr:50S ribosomal protein L40e [archaeon]